MKTRRIHYTPEETNACLEHSMSTGIVDWQEFAQDYAFEDLLEKTYAKNRSTVSIQSK